MTTDAVTSGITTAGQVFNGLWSFAGSNPIIMVVFGISIVGIGIALFYRLKSRLSGGKGRKGRR